MNRVEFSSSYAGPANFICPANPYIYDPIDSSMLSSIDILQGASIHQESYFDNRLRSFVWPAYVMTSNNIISIVNYFRSIKGQNRYFNLKDIEDMNMNWPSLAVSTSDNNWKYCRIVNLDIKYKSGGKLRYDTITLYVQPEIP